MSTFILNLFKKILFPGFFPETCGKRPSFFSDVYLHIVFIQCILDGYEEGYCQRQQDYKEKGENLSSRLYFSIWILLSPVIYEIFSKLH